MTEVGGGTWPRWIDGQIHFTLIIGFLKITD